MIFKAEASYLPVKVMRGPIAYWSKLRFFRDMQGDRAMTFTERQMVEGDTNLQDIHVINGQTLIFDAIGIMPNTPMDFIPFLKFLRGPGEDCEVEFIIPNQVRQNFVPLRYFFIDGEYRFRPRYEFDVPVIVTEGCRYAVRFSNISTKAEYWDGMLKNLCLHVTLFGKVEMNL